MLNRIMKAFYIVIIAALAFTIEGIAMLLQKDNGKMFEVYTDTRTYDIVTTYVIQGEYVSGYEKEEQLNAAKDYITGNTVAKNVKISVDDKGIANIRIEDTIDGCGENNLDEIENVEKACEKTGFDCDTTITITGKISGRLSEGMMEDVAGKAFGKMGVREYEKELMDNRKVEAVYSGYSPYLEHEVNAGGQRINIVIAFSYDETNDATDIYFATPVLGMDV